MTLSAYRSARSSPPETTDLEDARQIARIVLGRQRRLAEHPEPAPCEQCVDYHSPAIHTQMRGGGPIRFVLPAFPAKSPNPEKVLGPAPDLGEELAMRSLEGMCARIREVYRPGAHIMICSDGRVFSDSVGIAEEDVTVYQAGMRALLANLAVESLSIWGLDDVYPGLSHRDMRGTLMLNHGESVETLRASVKAGGHAQVMYRGITRFLFEDADRSRSTTTKSALQRDCRRRAYQVIARSNAWSNLLEKRFPDAIRLSIHPQPCSSKKIGMHVTDSVDGDQWLTPWHAVAVETPTGYRLMKRRDAEASGGVLVYQSGKPSHFVLAA